MEWTSPGRLSQSTIDINTNFGSIQDMQRLLVLWIIAGGFFVPGTAIAFIQGDLDRLLTTNECPACDLSGALLVGKDLAKAKLVGANLKGADLTKASLRMADLAGADLSLATLSGAVFDAADLFQADLSGAKVDGARFDGAYLAESKLDGDTKTLLAGAAAHQLSQVVAEEKEVLPEKSSESSGLPLASETAAPAAGEASLVAETPPMASEEGAAGPAQLDPPPDEASAVQNPVAALAAAPEITVTEAATVTEPTQQVEDLVKQAKKSGFCIECNFSGALLNNVSMKGLNLARANFTGAQLADGNFKEADLKGAIFRGANLKGAIFNGADLYLADFSGADLSDADFRGAILGGEVLSDATLTGARFDEPKK